MADDEPLKLLKKSVWEFNKWRRKNPSAKIDFNYVELSGADLQEANLAEVNLAYANLEKAVLIDAKLFKANLRGANLMRANLNHANLVLAALGEANLTEAFLMGADLKLANLRRTDLGKTELMEADLSQANLQGTNLGGAHLGQTHLGKIDFSKTKDLEKVRHLLPSYLSADTLKQSKGNIPTKFLRGCGLNDWEIEYAKLYQLELTMLEIDNILYRLHDLRAGQALQINPLFISYSHKDCAFVDAMEKHLNNKGIRFWRDIHHATAGRLEKVVDRAMRLNPTVLLVLSNDSVQSDWVEHEARSARELGKELKRDVLCPVALDDSWKNCAWPARLREQIMEYNILDFSNWKDDVEFTRKFAKLVEGLDLFYKET